MCAILGQEVGDRFPCFRKTLAWVSEKECDSIHIGIKYCHDILLGLPIHVVAILVQLRGLIIAVTIFSSTIIVVYM